ncbi:DUF7553 family protein [Halorussus litoreus]|uniref:DUF7553 family protein n=1 Tax=Halorussus litoreus TaxID=1710536 RepID=UPI000E2511E2|nr:FxLYD domain-containing protein [Halorussus litoreus]
MASIPPILDVRDDLYRALEATDEDDDLAAEIETVLDRFDDFQERDSGADPEGVVDEIDNQLLRVEQQLIERDDEDAARAIGSARNRIHIYRESVEQSGEDFAVVDSGVRHAETTDDEGLLPVGEATITATVANAGEDSEIVPVVGFYDRDGDEVESVRGPTFELPAGEQGQIELDVDVPSDAERYAVAVREAGP